MIPGKSLVWTGLVIGTFLAWWWWWQQNRGGGGQSSGSAAATTISTAAVPYGSRTYDVVAYPNQSTEDAVLLLRNLEQDMRQLIDHVAQIPRRDKYRFIVLSAAAREAIENLGRRFPAGKAVEIDELNLTLPEVRDKRILAWTIEKSEGFRVCIRANRINGQLAAERDVFATLVHELAHAARTEYEEVDAQGRSIHSAEFYEIYDFLVTEAIKIGLLRPSAGRRVSCAGMAVNL